MAVHSIIVGFMQFVQVLFYPCLLEYIDTLETRLPDVTAVNLHVEDYMFNVGL